jgi:hypothetical protein
MHRVDAWPMIRHRTQAIGLPDDICNHTFRATGITAYLENGGTIEHAQQIANHESPKTTKLYDRTSDQIALDEVEKIVIRGKAMRIVLRSRSIPFSVFAVGVICLAVGAPIVGFVNSVYDFRKSEKEFPQRHLEVTHSINRIYAHFQRHDR